MSSTAGKGPGIVINSRTGTGAVRVAPRVKKNQAALEVLDPSGGIIQIRMTSSELRLLAGTLMKVAVHLEANEAEEEVTQP
ncbi:MAG: hypothetical protein QM723_31945 [Myxococcaceae bacterium]